MRKISYILNFIFILTLIRCNNYQTSNSSPYKNFQLPDKTIYSEIISETIKQDTINFDKRFTENKQFSNELLKIRLVGLNPKTDSIYLQKATNLDFETNISELNYFNGRSSFHLDIDTLYFAFQSDNSKQITIDSNIVDFVNLSSRSTRQKNQSYYQFSLPLLNKKLNETIVICRYVCDGCGYIEVYLLEKINSKWVLQYQQTVGQN
ncbi:MAG: hypothetical protein K0S53_1572 [Bacteroidetes bacterium]|jgi:hypothetical protein|nr:hypothetical protein [Bacteroidota bacterium]